MSTPNRWAIKEAGEATFYNLSTGKAICTLSTLKTTGVETTGETVYARGGRGNAKLVGFSTNRESKLTLQDAIFDNNALAMLTGNSITASSQTIDRKEVGVTSGTTLTLLKTPVGALVSVYKLNPDGTNGTEYTLGSPGTNATEYSISAKVITFNAAVSSGTQFRVYYKVSTAADAKQIKVTSDQFGKTFKVVLDVIVVDEFTKQACNGQLIVPNAKFEDNFNLSFSADGDPAVLDLTMEILKSAVSTDMWQLVIYEDSGVL
jgi:hypothetical protein